MTGPDTPPNQPAESAILGALAPMLIIAEAVVGYHRKLVDGGVPEESAGRMAEEYHSALMASMPKAPQAATDDPRRIRRRDNR